MSEVVETAKRARAAAAGLAPLARKDKDAALHAMADALLAATDDVLAANARDVARGRDDGMPSHLIDRLTLDKARIEQMAEGLRDLASLPDPVGEVVRGSTLPNGLELRQVRVPLGVVGIVYEARPNVTVDAAGICLKSGNAVLLRGSSSAAESNRTLVDVIAAAAPKDAILLVEATESREDVKELMRLRGLVDVHGDWISFLVRNRIHVHRISDGAAGVVPPQRLQPRGCDGDVWAQVEKLGLVYSSSRTDAPGCGSSRIETIGFEALAAYVRGGAA